MYDFLNGQPLYIVLTITLICWTGIFVYLMKIDKKLSKLEKELGDKQ